MRSLSILDTTLREGEQFAGAFFSLEQQPGIARLLDAFGVAYIEVPSPMASPKIRDSIRRLSESGLR